MKKRILITIVGQGSITHIIRSGLAERMQAFCEPVIAIQWDQVDLIAELREKNFEVHILKLPEFSLAYTHLRLQINHWYHKKVLRTPSTKIGGDYFAQFWPLRKWLKVKTKRGFLNFSENFIPGYAANLIKKENTMLLKEAAYIFYKQWLDDLKIDGLFTVTPFLYEVEIIGKILHGNKKVVIASVHSFDNITKRGWPSFFFDHYIVWNKYNKAELQRINADLKEDDISIAGPPQFDFHFNHSFLQSKKEWLDDLELPANKKIILYGGGSGFLFRYEPQYLKLLDDALKDGRIKHDAIVLFRPHPLDKVDRWRKYIGESKFVYYGKSEESRQKLDFANVTMHSISQFVSTLKYTDIHINLCSTMCVDGSVFNKPQIGPFYDDIIPKRQVLLRNMYYQEHFLPIIELNALHLAHTKEQLIDLVNKMLENPGDYNKSCRNCVKEIITYTDGQSTVRVTAILEKFFS